MDHQLRCQSCGMPLSEGLFGTNEDGAENFKYCKFCFLNGAFVNPAQTLDEMIEFSIDQLTREEGLAVEIARDLANTYIPKLKRWKAN